MKKLIPALLGCLYGCQAGPMLVPVDCDNAPHVNSGFVSFKVVGSYEIRDYCPTSDYGCTYADQSYTAFTVYVVDELNVWRHEMDHVYCGLNHRT